VSSLPCDVDVVLEKNCRKCHSATPQFGAPMPLMTLADLTAPSKSDPSKKVHELAVRKIADDKEPMPPPPNERLSEADRKTLSSWSSAGAPAGSGDCKAPPTTPPATGVSCKPDLSLKPASPWEMPVSSGDEYVCWGAEINPAQPTHVVGFAPRIDNTKIVHHVVLFEAPSAVSPTPEKCSAGGSLQWRMVMGWAPGGNGMELPPDVGFPIKPGGSHYVVQMHYSNPQKLTGEKDTSGFDLCTSAPRKNEADVVAFGTQDIELPPGATTSRDCSITIPQQLGEMHIIAAMPHMHKLGTAMSTTLLPSGGGAEVDLGTVKAWSFNTQAWLNIDAAVKPGDSIRTVCTWKNTTGAPVSFGENTAQEMCYSFTMYWPRVNSDLFSWATPAVASQCK
jgi:copper type II ascorbate-dependent monooxygenase-like protein